MATLMAYRMDGSVLVAESSGESRVYGLDVYGDGGGHVAVCFDDVRLWPESGGELPPGTTCAEAMGAWAEAEALVLVTINGEQVWPMRAGCGDVATQDFADRMACG